MSKIGTSYVDMRAIWSISDFFAKEYNKYFVFFSRSTLSCFFDFYAFRSLCFFALLSATMYIARYFFSIFLSFLLILRVHMCILRFAHCIYSIFNYEISRTCVWGGVKCKSASPRYRNFLSRSRSLFVVTARSSSVNFRTRNCAKRGGQRSARHGGIICDGSRIRSFTGREQ